LEFRVWGSGFGVQGSKFWGFGLGFKIWGVGVTRRVCLWGLGFRV